jgi:zinc protease
MAARIYGPIPARGDAPQRKRPREPEPRAHRLVTLADEKVEQPSHQTVYLVPSYRTARKGEAEALEALAHLLGGGPTSLLYRRLVVEQKVAVVAECYYMGTALDETRFWIYAMPAPDVSLQQLDEAIEAIIREVIDKGVAEEDLARAKTRLVADAIYAQDNQTSLARWYGAALTTGMSVDDIRQWPERMDGVTAQDVRDAAKTWLDRRRAVTGFLLPKETEDA